MSDTLDLVADFADEASRLRVLVSDLKDLHRPFPIYDECGHTHTQEEYKANDSIVYIDYIGYTCNVIYHICSECCCEGTDREQSEGCLAHDHGPNIPICKTRELLDAQS